MTSYSGLVLLPGEEMRWLRFADGAHVGEGTGMPAREDGEAVVAIYSAGETTLFIDKAAGLPRAQAVAIGRLLATESCLTPIEELHFAAGAHIAVVEQQRFAAWLSALCAAGLEPLAVIPAQIVPEAPTSGFIRMRVGEEEVLRCAEIACLCDPAIDGFIVGDQAVDLVADADAPLVIARAAARVEVNLRQGPFAPARSWGGSKRFLWICGMLAGLALLATVLTPLVLAVRLHMSASSIDRTADDLARTVVAREEVEPQAALERRVTAIRGPGRGFSQTATAILSAVKSRKGSSLAALDFDAQGKARATVQSPNEADLVAIGQALEIYGFRVNRGPTSSTNGVRRTEFGVNVK